MQEIVASVQRVTDIMGEITAASVEQSVGIDQVNTAVTSMDEVTQQNAALVEQAAAAAESLVDQAANLIEVVSVFKLNRGGKMHTNRHESTKPIRTVAKPTKAAAPKAITDKSTIKKINKTGTEDGEWAEF